jgi:hypothetical protein
VEQVGREFYISPPRCATCGDVIGVYELLVHIVDDQARETSRAAEDAEWYPAGACWHVACYTAVDAAGVDF